MHFWVNPTSEHYVCLVGVYDAVFRRFSQHSWLGRGIACYIYNYSVFQICHSVKTRLQDCSTVGSQLKSTKLGSEIYEHMLQRSGTNKYCQHRAGCESSGIRQRRNIPYPPWDIQLKDVFTLKAKGYFLSLSRSSSLCWCEWICKNLKLHKSQTIDLKHKTGLWKWKRLFLFSYT